MNSPIERSTLSDVDLTGTNRGQVYHFEYTNIHNHRLALIRRVDRWHQIAYAAIFVLFSLMLGSETVRSDVQLRLGASLLGSLFLGFVMVYSKRLDNGVVRLYPRLVTLELILDYHFWRDYLGALGNREAKVVEKCESETADNSTELNDKVTKNFKRFPFVHRYLARLFVADTIVLFAIWTLPFYPEVRLLLSAAAA